MKQDTMKSDIDLFAGVKTKDSKSADVIHVQPEEQSIPINIEQEDLSVPINIEQEDISVPINIEQEDLSVPIDIEQDNLSVPIEIEQDNLSVPINIEQDDLSVPINIEQEDLSVPINIEQEDLSVPINIEQDDLSVPISIEQDDLSVPINIEQEDLSLPIEFEQDSVSIPINIEQDDLSVPIELEQDNLSLPLAFEQDELSIPIDYEGDNVSIPISFEQDDISIPIEYEQDNVSLPIAFDVDEISIPTSYEQDEISIPAAFEQDEISIPAAFEQDEVSIPTSFEQDEISIPTSFEQDEVSIPTSYEQDEISIPTSYEQDEISIPASFEQDEVSIPTSFEQDEVSIPTSFEQDEISIPTSYEQDEISIPIEQINHYKLLYPGMSIGNTNDYANNKIKQSMGFTEDYGTANLSVMESLETTRIMTFDYDQIANINDINQQEFCETIKLLDLFHVSGYGYSSIRLEDTFVHKFESANLKSCIMNFYNVASKLETLSAPISLGYKIFINWSQVVDENIRPLAIATNPICIPVIKTLYNRDGSINGARSIYPNPDSITGQQNSNMFYYYIKLAFADLNFLDRYGNNFSDIMKFTNINKCKGRYVVFKLGTDIITKKIITATTVDEAGVMFTYFYFNEPIKTGLNLSTAVIRLCDVSFKSEHAYILENNTNYFDTTVLSLGPKLRLDCAVTARNTAIKESTNDGVEFGDGANNPLSGLWEDNTGLHNFNITAAYGVDAFDTNGLYIIRLMIVPRNLTATYSNWVYLNEAFFNKGIINIFTSLDLDSLPHAYGFCDTNYVGADVNNLCDPYLTTSNSSGMEIIFYIRTPYSSDLEDTIRSINDAGANLFNGFNADTIMNVIGMQATYIPNITNTIASVGASTPLGIKLNALKDNKQRIFVGGQHTAMYGTFENTTTRIDLTELLDKESKGIYCYSMSGDISIGTAILSLYKDCEIEYYYVNNQVQDKTNWGRDMKRSYSIRDSRYKAITSTKNLRRDSDNGETSTWNMREEKTYTNQNPQSTEWKEIWLLRADASMGSEIQFGLSRIVIEPIGVTSLLSFKLSGNQSIVRSICGENSNTMNGVSYPNELISIIDPEHFQFENKLYDPTLLFNGLNKYFTAVLTELPANKYDLRNVNHGSFIKEIKAESDPGSQIFDLIKLVSEVRSGNAIVSIEAKNKKIYDIIILKNMIDSVYNKKKICVIYNINKQYALTEVNLYLDDGSLSMRYYGILNTNTLRHYTPSNIINYILYEPASKIFNINIITNSDQEINLQIVFENSTIQLEFKTLRSCPGSLYIPESQKDIFILTSTDYATGYNDNTNYLEEADHYYGLHAGYGKRITYNPISYDQETLAENKSLLNLNLLGSDISYLPYTQIKKNAMAKFYDGVALGATAILIPFLTPTSLFGCPCTDVLTTPVANNTIPDKLEFVRRIYFYSRLMLAQSFETHNSSNYLTPIKSFLAISFPVINTDLKTYNIIPEKIEHILDIYRGNNILCGKKILHINGMYFVQYDNALYESSPIKFIRKNDLPYIVGYDDYYSAANMIYTSNKNSTTIYTVYDRTIVLKATLAGKLLCMPAIIGEKILSVTTYGIYVSNELYHKFNSNATKASINAAKYGSLILVNNNLDESTEEALIPGYGGGLIDNEGSQLYFNKQIDAYLFDSKYNLFGINLGDSIININKSLFIVNDNIYDDTPQAILSNDESVTNGFINNNYRLDIIGDVSICWMILDLSMIIDQTAYADYNAEEWEPESIILYHKGSSTIKMYYIDNGGREWYGHTYYANEENHKTKIPVDFNVYSGRVKLYFTSTINFHIHKIVSGYYVNSEYKLT